MYNNSIVILSIWGTKLMMDNDIPKKLLPFIWHFLKKHPYCMVVFILVGLLAAARVSVEPYLLKIIIDTANKETNQPQLLLSAILVPAIIYALIPLLMNFVFCSWNYAYLTLFPKMRIEIITDMFDYLSQQSHTYFQKNFSGALANKISDMPQGIESIVVMFNSMIWPRFAAVIIACVLLYTVNLLFTFILFIWTCIFIGNSLYFSNKGRIYTITFSETNSAVSGQIVDSVANIASAKIFTNVEHESHRIQAFLEDLSLKDRFLQWYFLKMNFVQDMLYFILVAAMLSGAIYGRIQGWITLGDLLLFLPVKFTEVFLKPARFFNSPMEILESLEYTEKDKVQILRTWKYDIVLGTLSDEERLSKLSDSEVSKQIDNALAKLGESHDEVHT